MLRQRQRQQHRHQVTNYSSSSSTLRYLLAASAAFISHLYFFTFHPCCVRLFRVFNFYIFPTFFAHFLYKFLS